MGARRREARSDAERDAAVDDLIALVGGVDGILQAQAEADARTSWRSSGMPPSEPAASQVAATVLKAYRWQYIVSGAMEPRFQKVLGGWSRRADGAHPGGAGAADVRVPPPAKPAPRRRTEAQVAR